MSPNCAKPPRSSAWTSPKRRQRPTPTPTPQTPPRPRRRPRRSKTAFSPSPRLRGEGGEHLASRMRGSLRELHMRWLPLTRLSRPARKSTSPRKRGEVIRSASFALKLEVSMSSAVSSLAPTDVPDMPEISGVKLATAAAGIRHKGRTDVMLAVMDQGTTVAGVFTQSKCPSAPVEWCRAKLKGGRSSKAGFARALVVNSGNANAFTGKTGRQATALTASIAAKAAGCNPSEVFLASTGVIGEPLDATKFNGVLGTLAEQAAPGEWIAAAKAIMTTDTFPKVATATVNLGKAKVTINGMAKGAGMIAPDMDHAGVRVHRRADRSGRAAIAA